MRGYQMNSKIALFLLKAQHEVLWKERPACWIGPRRPRSTVLKRIHCSVFASKLQGGIRRVGRISSLYCRLHLKVHLLLHKPANTQGDGIVTP